MTENETVLIREELYDEVEKVVADNHHGYNDVSEFTREAIRLHLQRVVRPIIKTIVENRIKGTVVCPVVISPVLDGMIKIPP